MVGEALECLGGAGYVEESIMPRLYREAPLNGIWEDSGNIICLDVLRSIQKQPASMELMLEEIEQARGGETSFDTRLDQFKKNMGNIKDPELNFVSIMRMGVFGWPALSNSISIMREEGEGRVPRPFSGT